MSGQAGQESARQQAQAFREEVRAWLAENFPPALAGRNRALAAIESPDLLTDDDRRWQRAVGAKGWGMPHWPVAYGGAGLDEAQIAILREEMAAIGAFNPIVGIGPIMLGPTLLEFGTEEQKRRHLPGIASGNVRWCQGYSEPGAGSDLASLSTFGEDRGDHYVVNGQKTWTSGAQWADMCFALIRTDRARKYEGISFMLIDMHAPGVEVRPIRLISGSSPFCDTFFTDVIVPKADRVGAESEGWKIGKRLLQFERLGLAEASERRALVDVAAIAARHVGVDENGALADAELRGRIAAFQMRERAFELLKARVGDGEFPGGAFKGSALKIVGSQLTQKRDELILKSMGLDALALGPDASSSDPSGIAEQWLWQKAVSIFGGSTEIQNNIIAKRILEMPSDS